MPPSIVCPEISTSLRPAAELGRVGKAGQILARLTARTVRTRVAGKPNPLAGNRATFDAISRAYRMHFCTETKRDFVCPPAAAVGIAVGRFSGRRRGSHAPVVASDPAGLPTGWSLMASIPIESAVSTVVSPTTSRRFGISVVTAVAFVGSFLVQFDGSALNVAVVRIGLVFHASGTVIPWVVDAYAIAFASILLASGVLADRYGARTVFLAGLGIFTTASVICALAPGIASLVTGRAIQGLGGGLLIPSSLSLVSRDCGDDRALRARIISMWAASAGVAITVGPVVSGLFLTYLGWRSIFVINIPLGLVGAALMLRRIGGDHDDVAAAPARTNWAALALVSVMLLCLVEAIIETVEPGRTPVGVPILLGAVAGSFTLLVMLERHSPNPVIPRQFLASPRVVVGQLVGGALTFASFGLVFGLGLYFQRVQQYSPEQTGFAFVPFAATVTLANLIGGRLAGRFGAARTVVGALLLGAAGYAFLARIGPDTGYLTMLPAQIAARLGTGMAIPAVTSFVLSEVPRETSGRASGLLSTVRQVGTALGVAVYGTMTLADPVNGLSRVVLASAGVLLVAALALWVVTRRNAPN